MARSAVASGPPARGPKGCLRGLLTVVVLFATCTSSTLVIMDWEESRLTADVGAQIPDGFPVIVITEEGGVPRATALYHKEVDSFRLAHPEHSFLIPSGHEERLNQELRAASRVSAPGGAAAWDRSIHWDAQFEVLDRRDWGQYIRASKSHDDDRVNTGWYRATPEGYFLRQHLSYFGPSVAMVAALRAMLLTAVLFGIYVFWRRRRRHPHPAPRRG